MSGISLVSWLWRPAGRLPQVGWGDIALAALLSVFAIILVGGLVNQPAGTAHGGAIAALAVLTMTVPVAWERSSLWWSPRWWPRAPC